MNIVFGKESVDTSKYVALELDTLRFPTGQELTAYCVVDLIPILNMPRVQSMSYMHEELLSNYKRKDWNFCLQAIEQLEGFWGEDVDSFYQILKSRVVEYQANDPGPNWSSTIEKVSLPAE